MDLRTVDQATAEVSEAAVDLDLASGQQAHREGVLGPRVAHRDLGDAFTVDEPAQLQVDLAGTQLGRVQFGGVTGDDGGLRVRDVRLGEPSDILASGLGAGRLPGPLLGSG